MKVFLRIFGASKTGPLFRLFGEGGLFPLETLLLGLKPYNAESIHFFQGWIEDTFVFIGSYSHRSLKIGSTGSTYDMPLTCVLLSVIAICLSLLLMVRQ